MGNTNLYKIVFKLGKDDWHGYSSETLWAEKIGVDEYRIKNTPFYIYGVSLGDIVFGIEMDNEIVFREIKKYEGHSTYRVFLETDSDIDLFNKYWKPLEDIGCSYESKNIRFLAIDVPQQTDINRVYALLENGEKDGVWEFEEGHFGHGELIH